MTNSTSASSLTNAPISSAKTPRSFYDTHTTFEGYINRAVLVQSKGKPYWSVSICMLSGSATNPTKTTVDTIVRGAVAEQLIKQYASSVGKAAIFGRFKISDIESSSYINKKDNKAVHVLRGRLILIYFLNVAKDVVHCMPELIETMKDYNPITYNVETRFAGFINRANIQLTDKGNPYWAVDICMLSGTSDNPSKTLVKTSFRGGKTEVLIEKYASVLNDKDNKTAIFGSFTVANINPSSFINKKEDVIYTLQGRLTGITYLKVGKQVVLESKEQDYLPLIEFQTVSTAEQETDSQKKLNNARKTLNSYDEKNNQKKQNLASIMSFGKAAAAFFA